jgi:hypothetical protein
MLTVNEDDGGTSKPSSKPQNNTFLLHSIDPALVRAMGGASQSRRFE